MLYFDPFDITRVVSNGRSPSLTAGLDSNDAPAVIRYFGLRYFYNLQQKLSLRGLNWPPYIIGNTACRRWRPDSRAGLGEYALVAVRISSCAVTCYPSWTRRLAPHFVATLPGAIAIVKCRMGKLNGMKQTSTLPPVHQMALLMFALLSLYFADCTRGLWCRLYRAEGVRTTYDYAFNNRFRRRALCSVFSTQQDVLSAFHSISSNCEVSYLLATCFDSPEQPP